MLKRKNIEFRKRRDFGQKFNATFEFVKQEFKPMALGILYIGGPVIVLTAILQAYFEKYNLSFTNFTFDDPEVFFSDDLWGGMLVLALLTIVSYIFLFAIVNEYVKAYIKGSNNSITTSDLWNSIKQTLSNYALSVIGYTVILSIFLTVIVFIFVQIATMDSILLSVVGGIGVLILMLMSICVFYIAPIVFNTEPENLISSIGRTVELMKGKWASTFGLLVVASIIASIASFIFAIPYTVLTTADVLLHVQEAEIAQRTFAEQVAYSLSSLIATTGNYLLSVIPIVVMIFQYYNLVERRDATGLMGRIDQIGSEKEAGKDEDIDESF